MTVLASALAVVAGGFLSRETATLARQLIEAKLGKPRLVRETSRASHGFAVSLVLMPWQIGMCMHTQERERERDQRETSHVYVFFE
jgi:tryptophan synthase beta subunit